jgi:2'-5' RNA ligase
MRLFVALDLPEAVRDRVSQLAFGLPGARLVLPEQLHLTLSFIGDVNEDKLSEIKESLAAVDFPVFSLQLKGVGFFPPRKQPRVVWVGVAANSQLIQLQARIQSKLRQTGLTLEKRNFLPHITLARLQNTPVSRVGAFLVQYSLFMTPAFQVRGFTLYSSVLNPNGAKHYIEQQYSLH